MKRIVLFLLLPVSLLAQAGKQYWPAAFNTLKPGHNGQTILFGFVDDSLHYRSLLVQCPKNRPADTLGAEGLAVPDQQTGLSFFAGALIDSSRFETSTGESIPDNRVSRTILPVAGRREAALLQQWKRPQPLKSTQTDGMDYYDYRTAAVTWAEQGSVSLELYGEAFTGWFHPFHGDDVALADAAWLHRQDSRIITLYDSTLKTAPFRPSRRGRKEQARIKKQLADKALHSCFIDDAEDEKAILRLANPDSTGRSAEQHNAEADTTKLYYRLIRYHGETHLLAQADAPADYASSGDYQFTVALDLGNAGPRLPVKFDAVAAAFTGKEKLDDLFCSPEGSFAFLSLKDAAGYRLVGIRLSDRQVIFEKQFRGKIVLAQWAGTDQAGAWEKLLRP